VTASTIGVDGVGVSVSVGNKVEVEVFAGVDEGSGDGIDAAVGADEACPHAAPKTTKRTNKYLLLITAPYISGEFDYAINTTVITLDFN
jgi:hypothetical protein